MNLPAIKVKRAELDEKLKQLKRGMTLPEVRLLFGGDEFKTDAQNSSWRFRVTDVSETDPYEIYVGTFDDGKLTTGTILPKG